MFVCPFNRILDGRKLNNMRLHTLAIIILSTICFFTATAQMQIDHSILLTGSDTNARVRGIDDVSGNKDAVSVDYVQKGSLVYAGDAGTVNEYSVTLTPTISGVSYTTGMVVHFKANSSNTGSATLNVNGLGVATILKNFNVPLVADDIKAGQMVSVMYDGANFQMLSQTGNAVSNNNNNSGVPSGIIVMWSGAVESIPSGWIICDGNHGTPDLRNNFVIGAGNNYTVGDAGGAAQVTLTVNQLPPHTHDISCGAGNTNPYGSGLPMTSGGNAGAVTNTTQSTGSGSPISILPPYYALAYIMKQ